LRSSPCAVRPGASFALTLARAGTKLAIAKLDALAKEIAAADARALRVPLDVTAQPSKDIICLGELTSAA
jgi:hypothetical protein